MEPGTAGQTIQVSAVPDAYSQRMPEAKVIVATLWADSPELPIPADTDLSGITVPTGGTSISTVCLSGGASGAWQLPFADTPTVTSWWGPRVSPGGVGSTNHQGIDFGESGGKPILSISNGTVTGVASTIDGCGYWITIMYEGNAEARYCHMPVEDPLHVGDQVVAGQQVGTVGSTGHSTGNHLHININVNGIPVDPYIVLLSHGVDIGTLPYLKEIGPH